MEFAIHPLKGVQDVTFGMTSEDVRRGMNAEFRSFKRSPQAKFPCDYFTKEGIFCYYDESGLLESVEFAGPGRPIVSGLDLLNLPFAQAVKKLSDLDENVNTESDGAIANNLGVSVYAPLAKDNKNAPVESVMAFRHGYYD
jgi:hypothetical protein